MVDDSAVVKVPYIDVPDVDDPDVLLRRPAGWTQGVGSCNRRLDDVWEQYFREHVYMKPPVLSTHTELFKIGCD